MHLMYFTEQPMSAYPSDIGLATGHTALMFSNKYFDSAAGSRFRHCARLRRGCRVRCRDRSARFRWSTTPTEHEYVLRTISA